jgi:hypothetical protein
MLFHFSIVGVAFYSQIGVTRFKSGATGYETSALSAAGETLANGRRGHRGAN